MYNILIFDDITMNFSLVYMSDSLKTIISMYNYYRKKYDDSYIIVNKIVQSNEELLDIQGGVVLLIIITGKPGTGKTLTMTDYAREYFKEDNPPLKVWFTEKILRKKWNYKVRIYSDFPILFKAPRKRHKKPSYFNVIDDSGVVTQVPYISSLQCRIFDLILDNKFQQGAKFFFDEIQAKYDSNTI